MIAEVSCSYPTYLTCHRRPRFNPWLLLLRVTRVRHRNVAGMTSLCDHCTFAFRSYRCRAGWARSLRRCTAVCGTRMQSVAARSAARRAASSATAMWARRSLHSPFKEPQGSAQCRSVIRAHRRALIDLRSACWLVWLSVGKFRVTNSVHAVRTALDSAPSFRVRGGAGPGRDAQSHLGPSYIGPFPLQAADPS